MNGPFTVVVLISGRGSNMEALLSAAPGSSFRVTAVISNRADAAGLEIARKAGIATEVIDHQGFASREAFDEALASRVAAFAPHLVVLAGFMRILSEAFVMRFYPHLINLHPSILPAYPGLDTHRRALEAGDEIHGSTVHFVDTTLDGGPRLIQTMIKIEEQDDPDTLARRLLPREHALIVNAVELIASGQVELSNATVSYRGQPLKSPLRLSKKNEIIK